VKLADKISYRVFGQLLSALPVRALQPECFADRSRLIKNLAEIWLSSSHTERSIPLRIAEVLLTCQAKSLQLSSPKNAGVQYNNGTQWVHKWIDARLLQNICGAPRDVAISDYGRHGFAVMFVDHGGSLDISDRFKTATKRGGGSHQHIYVGLRCLAAAFKSVFRSYLSYMGAFFSKLACCLFALTIGHPKRDCSSCKCTCPGYPFAERTYIEASSCHHSRDPSYDRCSHRDREYRSRPSDLQFHPVRLT
jgi:hypothetical protein